MAAVVAVAAVVVVVAVAVVVVMVMARVRMGSDIVLQTVQPLPPPLHRWWWRCRKVSLTALTECMSGGSGGGGKGTRHVRCAPFGWIVVTRRAMMHPSLLVHDQKERREGGR